MKRPETKNAVPSPNPTPIPIATARTEASMDKKIAAFRNKMIGTVALVLGLALWQRHFVLEGITAHVEMNMTILSTLGFSTVLAFIFVAKLKNETIAFKALREMWDDIQHAPVAQARDPLWRHYRCIQPAYIFQRPRLLGHAYELVTEELARKRKMRVSVETMNTLVHTVEQSINDEKSLIIYLSGLLVFMGLIGTFIGLLHMVSSIGGIIGSLAGSAGGAGASSAFGELLAALQEPLKGMASGFASSLFGLFGSLVVGLLGRFAGQAAGVLKSEFEAWLAGVVQIGDEEHESALMGHPVVIGGSAGALDDPALLKMVGSILTDYSRVAGQFDSVTQSLKALHADQSRQSEITQVFARDLQRLEAGQSQILDMLAHASDPRQGFDDLRQSLDTLAVTLSGRMASDSAMLRDALAETGRQQASSIRLLTANQHQTTQRMAEAMEMLSADIDRRADPMPLAQLEAALARGAASGTAEMGRLMSAQSERLEGQIGRLVAGQAAMTEGLGKLAVTEPRISSVANSTADLETVVSDGLVRISQTMETAFSAYSGLLHVALAAVERNGRAPLGAETASSGTSPNPDLERMIDTLRKQAAAGRSA